LTCVPISRKRLLQASLALIGLAALLALFAWSFPQQVLCIESGPTKADAIVLLGGGSYERPARAAELFKEGVAPRIIITGAGDDEINRHLLLKAGVPDHAIRVESASKSTKENALFTIPLLREDHATNVILVTSWYHSRRTLKCFRHFAPDLRFHSRPSYYAYPRAEWHTQGIARRIRAEYPKLLGYWICYGVCPF
jgi:uncharacterized SAM-binding protein YcdF (DUF218 family)